MTTSFGSSPTFQATANTSGSVTLRATVSGNCGNFVVTRTIYVGAPPAAELQAPSGLDGCNTFAGSFQITNLNPAFTYSVSAGGSLRLFGGFNASTGTINVKVGAQTGAGYVTVVTQNACGSTTSSQTIDVPGCSTGTRFAVYPNPAQDETTVENLAAPSEAFDVVLYNGQGRLIYEKRAARGKVRLPLRELPPGLYHLHTGNGRQKETRTLQVTR
ncbi:T9SS type A sorting domain-containing protein [Hymenobacter yonginensis]|uniref:T9SS type A sorting domain-containing protein n=1 Tax=Hymenobacter yonginensis TaxID=748197 RepID=A0ABY7PUX9_9BACT|nr:T9SS type A sorting domain-containing protein [Hymenobacter yonginensis]WBO86717.1 T9SS type A sorting domain-containing protein [Hymenobacter yonginensis]